MAGTAWRGMPNGSDGIAQKTMRNRCSFRSKNHATLSASFDLSTPFLLQISKYLILKLPNDFDIGFCNKWINVFTLKPGENLMSQAKVSSHMLWFHSLTPTKRLVYYDRETHSIDGLICKQKLIASLGVYVSVRFKYRVYFYILFC